MTITISVPEQLAEQAAAQGLPVETYVEQLLSEATQAKLSACKSHEDDYRRAVDGLLTFRRTHRLTLDRDRALTVRAWLHQDHRV